MVTGQGQAIGQQDGVAGMGQPAPQIGVVVEALLLFEGIVAMGDVQRPDQLAAILVQQAIAFHDPLGQLPVTGQRLAQADRRHAEQFALDLERRFAFAQHPPFPFLEEFRIAGRQRPEWRQKEQGGQADVRPQPRQGHAEQAQPQGLACWLTSTAAASGRGRRSSGRVGWRAIRYSAGPRPTPAEHGFQTGGRIAKAGMAAIGLAQQGQRQGG